MFIHTYGPLSFTVVRSPLTLKLSSQEVDVSNNTRVEVCCNADTHPDVGDRIPGLFRVVRHFRLIARRFVSRRQSERCQMSEGFAGY
jgi:hypothetical protein